MLINGNAVTLFSACFFMCQFSKHLAISLVNLERFVHPNHSAFKPILLTTSSLCLDRGGLDSIKSQLDTHKQESNTLHRSAENCFQLHVLFFGNFMFLGC